VGTARRRSTNRETSAAVTRIAAHLAPGGEPRQALDGALAELIRLVSGSRLVFVALDQWGGRIYRSTSARNDTPPKVIDASLDPADAPMYLFPIGSDVWCADRPRGARGALNGHALDVKHRARRLRVELPKAFAAAQRFRSLLVMSAEGADQATYRLFIFNGRSGTRQLRTLRAIARQIGPALFSVEALSRLQSRIGAAERARVARDLHDGVIQSLIGLEMQVDVWRRQAAPEEASRLEHIQNALKREVVDLRDLIQHMRRSPVDPDPDHVLEHLAAIVEAFRRDTGIDAHFVSEIAELSLSPRVCDELIAIVREALVNVRKHSDARHVLVRASVVDGFVKFEVDDDGRGFGFVGRWEQQDLDVKRKGPVIIKERVRAIGGRLAIQSDPGRGACVEVRLPCPPRRV
jgi:signal transduction histidine kinase